MRRVALFALLVLVGGCTTYKDQLARSHQAFDANDHDRTLALLRDLEPDVKRLTVAEQAEYAYLRGTTDYRIGYRPDARHWLSVAKASSDATPGLLSTEQKTQVTEALEDLNNVVYQQGTNGLVTARKSDEELKAAAPAPKAKASKDAGAPPPAAAAPPPVVDSDAGVVP